ncbi:hypothetical protein FRC02_002848 [Tulasnella sp. 418]|nr:hypothetical protein FRC02_002848 [Tulasnella sp. 418]
MSLRENTSIALRSLFSGPSTPILPIQSADLLARIVTLGLHPQSKSTGKHLRLTDLSLLEDLLEKFSASWEFGKLEISREPSSGAISVVHVELVGSNLNRKLKTSGSETDSPPNSATIVPVMDAHHISKDLQEVYMMLQRGSAKGKLLAEQHGSSGRLAFEPICSHITKNDCVAAKRSAAEGSPTGQQRQFVTYCDKVHFRPLIRPHTDPTLGHCSYLNTCYSEPTFAHSPSIPPPPATNNPGGGRIGNMNAVSLPSGLGAGGRGKEKTPCRYLHFEVDYDGAPGEGGNVGETVVGLNPRYHPPLPQESLDRNLLGIGMGPFAKDNKGLLPAQWLNCDVRHFDYSVLGKFHAIMADPPWDIHMSLPYGTMTDDEMRAMPIPMLQDEGVLFLWVTGRAMEVGRECLRVWGYTRVDEVVWLKTNQLQRVIRTGRTGHWLNHTKEHMLVAIKTNLDADGNLIWPSWVNRGLDVDVIVSEVRETSRKPEEVYGLIERMCPGGRKMEIFGRKHNTRPGWLTLGNQLGEDRIYEEDLAQRIKTRYPERVLTRMNTSA